MNQDLFLSIIFNMFLSPSENSAHPHGALIQSILFLSVIMLAVTLLAALGHSQVCNRQPSHLWMIPVTRQKFSRKITPKRVIKGVKNYTSKNALAFFPLQVWTTRLSIYLRMSPMHQFLVAEISSATSNREIISIRKKSSAVRD